MLKETAMERGNERTMHQKNFMISLNSGDLENIMQRYHFCQEDFSALQSLSRMLTPLLQAEAYYIWKGKGEIISYNNYAVVFLTLGDGADALQEVYLTRNCLSEAYMIECIALEMLTKAYEEFVKMIQKETGKWAIKIDFLGETYPLELLPELYGQFGKMNITYNEKLVLSPGKSVVFLLPLSEKKSENPCNICKNCGSKECLFRKRDKKKEKEDRTEKLMHLYYGDGKGKTTAAIGLAVRAAGTGKKVLFTQFMKSGRTGELQELQRIENITVLRSKKQFPFYRDMTPEQKKEQTTLHNKMLDTILTSILQEKYDLVVLDEITYPYQWKLLDEKKLQETVLAAKGVAELVCTGRNPDAFFLKQADYVSEMKCVRHPFEKGIRARKGVEY